ncbi:MAG: tetratricopeptide repeat protein [Pseudomonadales bacterium]
MKSEDEELSPEKRASRATVPVSFWSELKRRKVTRVAMVYAIVGWLVIQIAGATFPSLLIPDWALSLVIMCIFLGFPVSLIFAWAFELTPEGLKTTTAAREEAVGEDESHAHDSKRNLFTLVFAVAIPTLIFGSLALVFYLRTPDGASLDSLSAHKQPEKTVEQSIAVLPLINMSAIGDNAFFAAGVHEDILTNLTRIKGLSVISRTSSIRYINSTMSLHDIGVELGVRYIVEGSVRRINNHVRVTVQLIDAANDTHLWASNYDRELVDVFATQSAVAKEISNSIHLELQPETVGTLDNMPTQSVKAYDVYLKARSIARSEPESESSLRRQSELLEQAVAEDPDFVEAWGYLNETYDNSIRTMNFNGWFVPEGADRDAIYNELTERSLRALNKAIALDPDNLETLLAIASDSVAEANADFRAERKLVIDHIIDRFPHSAMAWYVLGWWHNLEGNFDAARPAFEKALELDPLHTQMVEGSLAHFRMAGDQERVTQLFDRLALISPEKGESKSLAKISISTAFYYVMAAFMETADSALIADLTDLIEGAAGHYEDEVEKRYVNIEFLEIDNDMDALLAIQDDIVLPGNPNFWTASVYLEVNARLMEAQRLAGQIDTAKMFAQRIVAAKDIPIVQNSNLADRNHAYIATAYAILGQRDKAQKLVDTLLDNRSESYNAYGLAGFRALAGLDIDRSVKLLLEEKSRHLTANWKVTDVVAAYHISFRELIVHPEMQAYYLKEGKWIDYLADRVPEYAQYR